MHACLHAAHLGICRCEDNKSNKMLLVEFLENKFISISKNLQTEGGNSVLNFFLATSSLRWKRMVPWISKISLGSI